MAWLEKRRTQVLEVFFAAILSVFVPHQNANANGFWFIDRIGFADAPTAAEHNTIVRSCYL